MRFWANNIHRHDFTRWLKSSRMAAKRQKKSNEFNWKARFLSNFQLCIIILSIFSAAATKKSIFHMLPRTVQYTKYYNRLWYAIQYELWTNSKYVAPIGRLINLSCLLYVFIFLRKHTKIDSHNHCENSIANVENCTINGE